MTTVYVVTSGEYSDYRIDGLFSSKQLAEKFKQEFGFHNVEEWELDKRCQDEKCFYWRTSLDLETGGLTPMYNSLEIAKANTRVSFVRHLNYPSGRNPKGAIISKSYVSQEHADKLCVEKKQELLRTGALTDEGENTDDLISEA